MKDRTRAEWEALLTEARQNAQGGESIPIIRGVIPR